MQTRLTIDLDSLPLGYVFDRLRYPPAPFVLGLVLGPLLESNVRRMLSFEGSLMSLVTRPIALTFMLLAAASIAYYFWASRRALTARA